MIRIKLLTFTGAPEAVLENAASRVEKIIPKQDFKLVEKDPDVLFFLSGGSEQNALDQASPGRFYILIGSRHDNAYASATEVKACLNGKNIPSLLLDEEEPETREILAAFAVIRRSLESLNGRRLGLIGKVSEWLIASSVPAYLLKSRLGISLVEIPWSEAGQYSDYEPSGEFLDFYGKEKDPGLRDTARVSEMLTSAIRKWKLDAITVECFPMVQKHGVTACLPLARFNDTGIPAGCEGDLTSIAGMMLCRELTGIIPWMANINKATEQVCMFSHCTIAPGLVSGYSVTSHFETGKGTAIHGAFTDDRITIFRFDNSLTRAFLTTTLITGRPASGTACRTQIEVKLTPGEVRLLREQPLGNHHLILPGDHTRILTLACLILDIRVME